MFSMIRVILFGDTHLGFDLPARPRAARRRRGHDFQANYERVIDHALATRPHLVIHAGDVFDRPLPRPALVDDAFRPLWRLASAGVPSVVLAGNHERSRLPRPLFAGHPLIHVVDAPQALSLRLDGVRVLVAALPYLRRAREAFGAAVAATGALCAPADVRLLLVHQCFEGARVEGHVFRGRSDVIRAADYPPGIAALLSGHIHRQQRLDHDLGGRPLPGPMIYAGSTERTSYAERDEPKGFLELGFEPGPGGGRLVHQRFQPLPARPMSRWSVTGASVAAVQAAAARRLASLPADAVVQLRVNGPLEGLGAAWLADIAPPSMNIEIRPAQGTPERRRG